MAAEKIWRLFPTLAAPMPLQMTLDRLLFEKHCSGPAAPILRIFYSSEPWLTVGYAAEKKSGYPLADSKHDWAGIPVCRRPTAGGNVIHGRDLIFTLIAGKQDNPEKFESVETSYYHIHTAVQKAFGALDCAAEFCGEKDAAEGRDCFFAPVATDLKINGRKAAGGAQKRSGDFFLHEESLQPPHSISLEKLESALLVAFTEYFDMKLEQAMIEPEILIAAENQAQECILQPPVAGVKK